MIHRNNLKKILMASALSFSFGIGSVPSALAMSPSEAEDKFFAAVFEDPANLLLNFKLAGAQLEK